MDTLAVFDWNGTLLDDTKAVLEADNRILDMFGGKQVSLTEFQDTMCIPKKGFFELHGFPPDIDWSRPSQIHFEHYESLANSCGLRAGTLELLEWLRDIGAHSIILSNHTSAAISQQLSRLGLVSHIDHILANSDPADFIKGVRKEDRLRIFLEKSKFPKARTFIFGDTTEEIEISRSLGMQSIAVTGGCYSEARLKAQNPNFVCSDLREVIPYLSAALQVP